MKKFTNNIFLFLFIAAYPIAAVQQNYDPLSLPKNFKAEIVDLTVHEIARQREIPVRVYLPPANTPAPVILFSHGLGGSREGNIYLGEHWSARGYICVFIQHPGSDESVWKDKPKLLRLAAMRKAASLENFMLRVKDVSVVIDKLEEWNKSVDHSFMGRFDLGRIGMSGHSFGAVTTQAVSGEVFQNGKISVTDKRIKAAIAMSPSSSKKENNPKTKFGNVKIPWMLMTGTKDVAVIGDQDVESRLLVFPNLPSGSKYEIVLYNAEHSAFSDRALPGDKEEKNPNHHRVILALSTAFWDAFLKENKSAVEWLNGSSPSSAIEKNDRWQLK